MSEPCQHQRDTTKSFVGAVEALTAMTAERDAALAKVARLEQQIHDALEPNQPKGTP